MALNGDTANKIGTYTLAVLGKHHNVPFYVAMPSTRWYLHRLPTVNLVHLVIRLIRYYSYNRAVLDGSQIKIEQRPADEMTSIKGVLYCTGTTVLTVL